MSRHKSESADSSAVVCFISPHLRGFAVLILAYYQTSVGPKAVKFTCGTEFTLTTLISCFKNRAQTSGRTKL